MGRRKIYSSLDGVIEYLLKKGISYRSIKKELKGQGHDASLSTIHRVKHFISKSRNLNTKKPKPCEFGR
jgi:transposase-like protein